MGARNYIAVAFGIATVLVTAVQGQRTCAAIAADMQTGTCRMLESTVSSVSVADMTCGELRGLVRTLPPAPEGCCPDLRDFVTLGCACDSDVISLLQLAGATLEQIVGAVRIAQTADCTTPERGGPMFDPCTSSVGCIQSSVRRLLY
eukprot:jgi/Botrbrau1/6514/Bobra.0034s0087.1